MRKLSVSILFISLLILPVSAQKNFSKASQDSLLALLEQKDKAMGSLAVMENGQLVYAKAIGFASVSPEKVSADVKTRYRIGSISKMFTSVLIFQLIEENRIQSDTKLSRFFPSIKNSENITVGNMLNHRSGIHSFTNEPAYQTYMNKGKSKKEMIDIMSVFDSDFEPGSKFEYSNSNYVLLGYIVEELRKDTYENVLQKYICSKAGLADTHYGTRPDISGKDSYSFNYTTGWNKLPDTDMSIPHGAGALVSTPSDLVKFISALFEGKLISKESLDKMKTITDGMGYGIQQFPYENKTVYGHGGGIDGFNSILVYIPEDRLSVSYISNGTIYPVNSILLHTINNFYGKPDKLPEFRVYNVDPADLDKYTGTYSSAAIPVKITITKLDGKLIGQGTGQAAFPLEATGKDEFKFEAAGIIMRFRPEKGEFDLLQGGGTFLFKKE